MRLRTILILSIALASCSSKSLLTPDCHSCTASDQAWVEFDFAALKGKWQGVVEQTKSDASLSKKEKKETFSSLTFLDSATFLAAHGAAECPALKPGAVVLNGVLSSGTGKNEKEFEAFVPVEEDKVAYGRLKIAALNGKNICQFRRLGRLMGQNRLSLPSVSFSDRVLSFDRKIASSEPDSEVYVEFLRFAPGGSKMTNFTADGRKPASAVEQERPQLLLRVFRVATTEAGGKGAWRSTEEQIYRLWKSQ